MFERLVTDFFMFCVYVLQVIGGSPGEFGYGYYLANILIFVILQPALIILFFVLWRLEKKKNKSWRSLEQTPLLWSSSVSGRSRKIIYKFDLNKKIYLIL